jgi:hypothetical protein
VYTSAMRLSSWTNPRRDDREHVLIKSSFRRGLGLVKSNTSRWVLLWC